MENKILMKKRQIQQKAVKNKHCKVMTDKCGQLSNIRPGDIKLSRAL